jgi:copper homeostasis protein
VFRDGTFLEGFSTPGILAGDGCISGNSGLFVNREAVMMDLEICVDSVESAIAAEQGGAQRIELCSALSEGGLTPSLGLIRAVRSHLRIGVYVMIRPRGGDFFYSEEEFSVMRDDIVAAAEAGANGVVLGLLTSDGKIDVSRTRQLVEEAVSLNSALEVTFHRAIDMSESLESSLEAVIQTGAHRVLTSGGAQNALLGSSRVAGLVNVANGRIRVMVCGNVRPENVQQIAQTTGAHEFHAALRRAVPSPVSYRNPTLNLGEAGNDEYARHLVFAEDVRELRQAMDGALSYAARATG